MKKIQQSVTFLFSLFLMLIALLIPLSLCLGFQFLIWRLLGLTYPNRSYLLNFWLVLLLGDFLLTPLIELITRNQKGSLYFLFSFVEDVLLTLIVLHFFTEIHLPLMAILTGSFLLAAIEVCLLETKSE